MERIPSQFCPDGLLLEFGASPNEGRADHTSDHTQPVILDEKGGQDDEHANSHHVWPAPVAKVAFTANNEREAESDDEEGDKSEEDAEGAHSYQ